MQEPRPQSSSPSVDLDTETLAAASRCWAAVSRSHAAVNQTRIGKAIIGRCVASERTEEEAGH